MVQMIKQPVPAQKRLAAAFYFGVASILVQTATKAIFTTFGFKQHLIVALLQMAFTSIVLFVSSRASLDFGILVEVFPLSMVSAFNIACGLMGTGGLSVPMFIALRRFTLVFSLLLEYFILRQTRYGFSVLPLHLVLRW